MTTNINNPQWLEAVLARVDARDLAALADCRRSAGVRALIVDGRAWVDWRRAPLETRRAIIERLLPRSSVEFFTKREDGHWYRPGAHLPAFDVPREIEEADAPFVGLERVLLPRPLASVAPENVPPRAVVVRLARTIGPMSMIAPRRASALRCRLDHLAAWADRATSARIEALSAACAPGEGPGGAEVLVLGTARALPEIPEATRYWGSDVLLPLGISLVPDLPALAVRAAVGAGPDDLLEFHEDDDKDGPELVPRSAFAKLSRASIRRALHGELGDAGAIEGPIQGAPRGPLPGGQKP